MNCPYCGQTCACDEIPIVELDLSNAEKIHLMNSGIYTLSALVNKTDQELLKYRMVGPNRLRKWRKAQQVALER